MVGEYPLSVHCIQEELETVFAKLKTCLSADASALLDRYLPQFGVDPVSPPALVLLSSRLFSDAGDAILPALFMVFIHLAMTLHSLPRQIQGRDRQLVILEGDYLYAHLFFLLCQTDCLHLLERFSRLIREVNEGSMMRHLYEQGSLPRMRPACWRSWANNTDCFLQNAVSWGGYSPDRRRVRRRSCAGLAMSSGLPVALRKPAWTPVSIRPFWTGRLIAWKACLLQEARMNWVSLPGGFWRPPPADSGGKQCDCVQRSTAQSDCEAKRINGNSPKMRIQLRSKA